MPKKKKKWVPDFFKTDPLYITLKNKIIQNNQFLHIPDNTPLSKENISFSSFNIQSSKYTPKLYDFIFSKSNAPTSNKVYRCFQLDIKLNLFQENVLKNWRRSYIFMYNATLAFLKKGVKPILNTLFENNLFIEVKELKQKIINNLPKISIIENKICELKKFKKKLKKKE